MATKRIWGGALRLYLGLVLAFLYLPIAVMAVMAFNRSALYELPIVFDTVWFESLPSNERLLQASYNSVALATANMVIATTLGTMAALAFARYSFRGKTVLLAAVLAVTMFRPSPPPSARTSGTKTARPTSPYTTDGTPARLRMFTLMSRDSRLSGAYSSR